MTRLMFSVPSSVAAPLTASRSYCVPGVVPPIWTFRAPAPVWV